MPEDIYAAARREHAVFLRREGLTCAEAGRRLGVSALRVSQMSLRFLYHPQIKEHRKRLVAINRRMEKADYQSEEWRAAYADHIKEVGWRPQKVRFDHAQEE